MLHISRFILYYIMRCIVCLFIYCCLFFRKLILDWFKKQKRNDGRILKRKD